MLAGYQNMVKQTRQLLPIGPFVGTSQLCFDRLVASQVVVANHISNRKGLAKGQIRSERMMTVGPVHNSKLL